MPLDAELLSDVLMGEFSDLLRYRVLSIKLLEVYEDKQYEPETPMMYDWVIEKVEKRQIDI